MAWQRYDNYDAVPTLIRPQTFDFRTEADIWNEIDKARNADAPPFIIHQLFIQLLNNLYATDPKTQKVFETIVNADKLFSLGQQAIALRKASNTVENWELGLHDSSLQLINEIMREDEKYIDKPLSERVTELVDKSKSAIFTPSNNLIDSLLNQT